MIKNECTSFAVLYACILSLTFMSAVISPCCKVDDMNSPTSSQPFVVQKKLDNGLIVLVRPVHTLPKVSIQMWYGVGSRDETDKERGIAHLIEHMIFKGTQKITESDINIVTHMLSGNCNAFTSYDYTGYLFNFPTHHWKEALPIMADCMENCTFKEDMLSSEMQAVIQELKMYRDNYPRMLGDELLGTIFADHPYHHPIIGYKQDLWSVRSKNLHDFYKKHYVPNNAVLVVVGDVDPQDVFDAAQTYFGHIKPKVDYERPQHYFTKDIGSKTVTLYRDVQQPLAAFVFVVPGAQDKKDYALQTITWVLGKGKSSRLYRRLVEDLRIATSVDVGTEDLFEYGLLIIECEPRSADDIPAIRQEIINTINAVAHEGITEQELTKAIKHTQMALFNLLEDIEHQAYEIGKSHASTGDPQYLFTYINLPREELKKEAEQIIATYIRPTVMHEGFILPLPESERKVWQDLQAASDSIDSSILKAHERKTPLEKPQYAHTIKVKNPGEFNFPKATTWTLDNGLKLFTYRNTNTPKINIILNFRVDNQYDPQNQQGICLFVGAMLTEGTQNQTAQEFAQALEERGISLSMQMGTICMSLLPEDFDFALRILRDMVTKASFDEEHIEKVRVQLLAQLKNFWDNPRACASQLTRECIYKNHPYSKNSFGTQEALQSISRSDLLNFYKQYSSPHGTRIAIVGDITPEQVKAGVEKYLSHWQGPDVSEINYPPLTQTQECRTNYYLNRDQVVLTLARLSVERTHPDFDKLLLFDQIMGGGVLGSMSSRLFKLREQSGLFYTINGTTLSGAQEQPGMFMIRTIVSLDRLQEAERVIRETIATIVDSLTEDELEEAKRAVINTLVNNFESNQDIASTFLFVDRYKLPTDFFDQRAKTLEKITLKEVQEAARRVLTVDKLFTLCVGRVGKPGARYCTPEIQNAQP